MKIPSQSGFGIHPFGVHVACLRDLVPLHEYCAL